LKVYNTFDKNVDSPPPGLLCVGKLKIRYGLFGPVVDFTELLTFDESCDESRIKDVLRNVKGLISGRGVTRSIKVTFNDDTTVLVYLPSSSDNDGSYIIGMYRVTKDAVEEDILAYIDAYAVGSIISELIGEAGI